MTQTAATADHLSLFQQRADRFTEIVEAVGALDDSPAAGWDVPSPCADWSAREVVGHVLETQRDFLQRQDLDAGPEPDLADPAGAWRRQRQHLTSVLAAEGVAAREYDGYFGRTTVAATLAEFYGWDLVIHGSDVARATGQPWSVTEAEADKLVVDTEAWGDALYSEGVCGPAVEVGPDASATDRLLGLLGRDPAWEPSISRPAGG